MGPKHPSKLGASVTKLLPSIQLSARVKKRLPAVRSPRSNFTRAHKFINEIKAGNVFRTEKKKEYPWNPCRVTPRKRVSFFEITELVKNTKTATFNKLKALLQDCDPQASSRSPRELDFTGTKPAESPKELDFTTVDTGLKRTLTNIKVPDLDWRDIESDPEDSPKDLSWPLSRSRTCFGEKASPVPEIP